MGATDFMTFSSKKFLVADFALAAGSFTFFGFDDRGPDEGVGVDTAEELFEA